MMAQFSINIPNASGDQISINLGIGEILYVLGANGTGKSSLISRLFSQNQASSKRISAHRQTWFESSTLNMTAHDRQNLEQNLRSQDANPQARYREWNSAGRASMTIFDLVDADTMQERKIAGLVRSGEIEAAQREARNSSPIKIINDLMQLSNIPIEISLQEGQKIVARKNGGDAYSVAELSDGERNAFLIAAEVLTAKPGALILVDEPERHLHRSIISPLLNLLFQRRNDCAFVVSTHEPMLPLDTPRAFTLFVRSCEYQGQTVHAWTADLLAPGTPIDDTLKGDILGSRRKIIFVEGTAQSLDLPMYSLVFPQVSIVPKEGCREVEFAVRGLRGASDVHWVSAWGIIDSDQRSESDIKRLRDRQIWALSHYSIESLYYHPTIISRIAHRQAGVMGGNPARLVQEAITSAIAAVNDRRDHLVNSTVLRSARNMVLANLPSREVVQAGASVRIEVDIAELRATEEKRFDELISKADWDGLLSRYPLRESGAFGRVVHALKVRDQIIYQSSVLKLLQDDAGALSDLRDLFGDLYEIVTA